MKTILTRELIPENLTSEAIVLFRNVRGKSNFREWPYRLTINKKYAPPVKKKRIEELTIAKAK